MVDCLLFTDFWIVGLLDDWLVLSCHPERSRRIECLMIWSLGLLVIERTRMERTHSYSILIIPTRLFRHKKQDIVVIKKPLFKLKSNNGFLQKFFYSFKGTPNHRLWSIPLLRPKRPKQKAHLHHSIPSLQPLALFHLVQHPDRPIR